MEEVDWYNPPQPQSDELVLSASSVGCYLRCPAQWEFRYIRRVRRPPTVRQVIGLAGHVAFETNLLAKVDRGQDLPEDTVLDVFSDEYDERSRETWDDPEDPIAKAKDQGVRVVEKQHRDIAPGIFPTFVEESFQFRILGVHYSGTFDFADHLGQVRDWKIVARKPSGSGTYGLAMTGYALGYRQKTGQIERAVQLDVIQRHKRDAPSYYPVNSGRPLSDETIALFADTVKEVHDGILAGRFPYRGIFNQTCGYCDYRDLCPAYKAAFG